MSPIFLPMPAHNPRGPDGKGWNRLSIDSMAGDECALRPTDYPTMIEARDTRRAGYGGFGPCIRQGACQECPIYAERTQPKQLQAFTDQVLVRIWPPDRQPRLMNHPEKGWSSFCYPWSWSDLAQLVGWKVGPLESDEHSRCFWLERVKPKPEPDGPWWKGLTPEEQREGLRDLSLAEMERQRAQYASEERRLDFVRPVYAPHG